MKTTVGKKNDRKTLDSAGFTKAAELITGSTRMTTRKPHRFGQKSANSRFIQNESLTQLESAPDVFGIGENPATGSLAAAQFSSVSGRPGMAG